jgi:threonine dehydrogenase-like Zn-dependent dehydrogenase
VAVPPLIPCGKCAQCLIGEPSRCEDYDYFGSRRDGAYAELCERSKRELAPGWISVPVVCESARLIRAR